MKNAMPLPILTITPHPAIDETVSLPSLRPGAVNVATQARRNAGGKGINVASCLADWGAPVVALGLLGQDNAAAFEALFARKGIADACQRVPGSTRTNIKIVAADTGDTTDINLPGPAVPAAAWQALLQDVRQRAQPGQWALAAGSLPPGLQTEGYAPLLKLLHERGARIALDTSGAALKQALACGVPLALIKPNRHELETLLGRPLPTCTDLREAARGLHAQGVETVVVSLGAQGAFMSSPEGAWLAAPLPVKPVSTVGAGDAQVAGLLAARHAGLDWREALRHGVAFATAKLKRLGPDLPPASEINALLQAITLSAIPS
ncbi:1-phosphofructokinase [Ottowia cancrivicina]